MTNEHGLRENFVDRVFSDEHARSLPLASRYTATFVMLHGVYDPSKPLIVHRERDPFIAACDLAHPDGEPSMLGKVRGNVFLPIERDVTLFMGQ